MLEYFKDFSISGNATHEYRRSITIRRRANNKIRATPFTSTVVRRARRMYLTDKFNLLNMRSRFDRVKVRHQIRERQVLLLQFSITNSILENIFSISNDSYNMNNL